MELLEGGLTNTPGGTSNTAPIVFADDLVLLIPGNGRRVTKEREIAAMTVLESSATNS